MINCKQCLKKDRTLLSQYIGQTGCTLRERFGEHRQGIQNNTDESVPIHFNLPHRTLNDVELIPLLKVGNSRDSYPLYIAQPLHCICFYNPCFILQSYWSIIFVVLFQTLVHTYFQRLTVFSLPRSKYWHLVH